MFAKAGLKSDRQVEIEDRHHAHEDQGRPWSGVVVEWLGGAKPSEETESVPFLTGIASIPEEHFLPAE